MLYNFKNKLGRKWFDYRARGVLRSQPLKMVDDANAPLVLSQLQHKDVLMYLVAIQSFSRQLGLAGVHVVNDGSLTEDDRALLGQYVPGIQFHELADCREPGLPQGGCWERLIAIARLSRAHYVIQLDADTLTLAGVDEVENSVRNGQSFSIGTWDGQTIEAAVKRAHAAHNRISGSKPHIQLLAEAHFDRLNEAANLRYVRGCAGFSGFSPGEGKLELMHALSGQLQALLGDRWLEWGSEQVMSNLVVANQPGATVLPHPDYADCIKMRQGTTRFIHFIGTCRFRGGVYAGLIGGFNWGRR